MTKKHLLLGSLVVIALLVLIAWKNEGPLETETAGSTSTPQEASQTAGGKTTTSSSGKTTSVPSAGSSASQGTTNTNPGNVTPMAAKYQINYTDQGFMPASAVVKAGQTVRFMNQGGQPMLIVSDSNYPGFGATEAVSRGEYYDFTFTKAGSWYYHNGAVPSIKGVVKVQ